MVLIRESFLNYENNYMDESGNLKELITSIKNGDENAFEELVKKTQKSVFSIAFKMIGNWHDAFDVCQEVYLKIFRYIDSYDPDKKFQVWLYKIVINSCYNLLNSRTPRTSSLDKIEGAPLEVLNFLEEDYGNKQLLEKALTFLNLLSPTERAVFILRDVQNIPSKEISKIVGCTQITVRRHSNNARKKMRTFLENVI